MKKIRSVTQDDVWQHWMRVENFSKPNFRGDIRDPLPNDLSWSLAEIEEHDASSMFIISSGDWTDISGGTFRVLDVASRLNAQSDNADTRRLASDIKKKCDHLSKGGELDSKLIAVTHDTALNGPITFIEGNRRSVAFTVNKSLIGKLIFVGASPSIVTYKWAQMTYRHK